MGALMPRRKWALELGYVVKLVEKQKVAVSGA